MKKNTFIICLASIVVVGVIGIVLLTSEGGVLGSKVKITKNVTSEMTYDKFDNGLISLEIPKGWKVETGETDYIHYTFKAYNPENPAYFIIFGLKQEGFLKSEHARSVYGKYYPDAPFAIIPAIDPQTTEAYYNVWNATVDYIHTYNFSSPFYPKFYEFNVIQNLGQAMTGGDILRATYKDEQGNLNQGLFTASVMSIGTYYINEDIWNLWSNRVDVSPLNVYNIMMMSAPDAEFNEWESILDHCLGTIMFSDTFVDGFNREETTLVQTIQANQKVYDQISDMIMDSWEKRSNSYDIISQKQSDATLGYDRVYDTETGEIYKADLDFMDHDWNGKYERVTDDMYTLPTSGYIEKR